MISQNISRGVFGNVLINISPSRSLSHTSAFLHHFLLAKSVTRIIVVKQINAVNTNGLTANKSHTSSG